MGIEVHRTTRGLDDLSREGPGHVDRAERAGDVGDVKIEPPLCVPLQHVSIYLIYTTGRCRDVVVIFAQTRCHTVVANHTLFTGQYGVAGFPNGLLDEAEGVNAIHELCSIWAAKFNATKGTDVNYTYTCSNGTDFSFDQ